VEKHRKSSAPSTEAETVLDGVTEVGSSRGRGKPLENGERNAILQAVLSHMKNRKLKHGALGLVLKQFNLSRLTVSNILERGSLSVEDGSKAMVVSHHKKEVLNKAEILFTTNRKLEQHPFV
jgi:hypothetical protein